MSWVNLNDVYVNKTGDTITGDLAVNGALTANALTANGDLTVIKDSTTYNVADEISTLRDSVSSLDASVCQSSITMPFIFITDINSDIQDIYCSWITSLLKENYPNCDLEEWDETRCTAYFWIGDKAASTNLGISYIQYYRQKTWYNSPFYQLHFNQTFSGAVRINGCVTLSPGGKYYILTNTNP